MIIEAEAASVERVRRQTQALLEELCALVEQEADRHAFFTQFLSGAVSGLAALGGAVWKHDSAGPLELFCKLYSPNVIEGQEEPAGRHGSLIAQVATNGTPLLVPPAGPELDVQHLNPTEHLLVLTPIKDGPASAYVLEVFQRGNAPQSAHRGYLSFMGRLCELAETFLKNCRLREVETRLALRQQSDQIVDALHNSLDSGHVCHAIANEGRRFIGCDRVSVALRRGKKCRTIAVSGQDVLESRSETVRALDQLATVILRCGQPFWYSGNLDDAPPQIAEAVENYVELTHSKLVGVLPLERLPAEGGEAESGADKSIDATDAEPFGVMIVEQIDSTRTRGAIEARAAVVCRQSIRPLTNAIEHESILLLPLWKTLGKSRTLVKARNLPKTTLAAAAALVLTLVLLLVPYSFNVHATGTLQPLGRRDVFAPQDSTVERVLVTHGQQVVAEQTLIELRNTDLEVSLADMGGQIAGSQEQLSAIERSLVEDSKRLSPEERNRLSGERSELRQRLSSLTLQRDLLQRKRDKLRIVSPLDGEVTTWNVEELLQGRPVRQGQVLLNLADTSSEWELELRIPEDRIGHLARAQDRLGKELSVTYRIALEPGIDYQGTVSDVHLSAEVHGDEGNTVLVRVKIDKEQLAHLQPGVECRAKVNCGKRSLGYVLFNDVIAFVQSRILFRL
jgi:multidrug efflux pump subunit AcrA (membrane-fusion protein)